MSGSQELREWLAGHADHRQPDHDQQAAIARELGLALRVDVYASSLSTGRGLLLALARDGRARRLVAAGVDGVGAFASVVENRRRLQIGDMTLELGVGELTHDAACALRGTLPWTGPGLGGLTRSVGLGDRLGLATPGHLRAVGGSGCFPFLAQQSIREMTRTRRTAAQVMDDATWGVFQSGWRDGFGSDADHLKQTADIDACHAVGFTMFTIDPGDHVRSQADTMDDGALDAAYDALPWRDLETSAADFKRRYLGRSFALDGGDTISFNARMLAWAAIKYSGAVLHTARMFRHLQQRKGSAPFELEVSVDETATPTTVAEHYLMAAELKRLGVRWVSLAPRFVGEFEKGIDYKGDLGAFEQSYARHVAIARTLGPYKLSLHSGSDKFSVYPIAARLSGELVHLKTAGTSYLEALRVVARRKPELYRRILDFAFGRFDEDKASYHISARLDRIPRSQDLSDEQLETILDGNDGRQLLHVTYGSVLTSTRADGGYQFRDELVHVLIDHEEEHYAVLAEHLGRHIRPFAR